MDFRGARVLSVKEADNNTNFAIVDKSRLLIAGCFIDHSVETRANTR
jgi:hypothetical protein